MRLGAGPSTRLGAGHKALLAAVVCLAGYVYAYADGPRRHADSIRRLLVLRLPAGVVRFTTIRRLPRSPTTAAAASFPAWTAIIRWPVTRHWVDAHPIGEAILIAPFFAVAHALTRWTNLSPDGFTPYYQHAAGLAGLCYVVAGLWFLRRLLRAALRRERRGRDAGGAALRHQPVSTTRRSTACGATPSRSRCCAALLERLDAWRPKDEDDRDAIVIGAAGRPADPGPPHQR